MPASQRRYATALPPVTPLDHSANNVAGESPRVSTPYPGSAFLVEFDVTVLVNSDASSLVYWIERADGSGYAFDPQPQIPVTGEDQAQLRLAIVDAWPVDAANLAWQLIVYPVGGTADDGQVLGGVASVTVDVGGLPSPQD
jgi:hypothetical protein